jgi:hypothetical protein
MTITNVGKKAKSRLLDYKKDQEDDLSIQQMRKEANERKEYLQKKLRDAASKERIQHLKESAKDIKSVKNVKLEQNLRKEINSVMTTLKKVNKVAF